MYMSICLYIYLSNRSLYLSVCLFIYLSVCVYLHFCVLLSNHLSIYPPVCVPVCLFVCLSFFLPVYRNKRLCIIHLPVYIIIIIVVVVIIIANKLSQRATHLTFIQEVPRLYVGHNIKFSR